MQDDIAIFSDFNLNNRISIDDTYNHSRGLIFFACFIQRKRHSCRGAHGTQRIFHIHPVCNLLIINRLKLRMNIQRDLRIIRSYVFDDDSTLLVRYERSRDVYTYSFITPSTDLFNYLIAKPRAIDSSCVYRRRRCRNLSRKIKMKQPSYRIPRNRINRTSPTGRPFQISPIPSNHCHISIS